MYLIPRSWKNVPNTEFCVWFGPAAPYSQHFSAPHPLRRDCGFFFFKYMYMYIYMVEVRSAAFVGVRDTFSDEPTDWDIICLFVSFRFVN